MQAAAGIRVVVGMLVVRAAGLGDAIVWPNQGRVGLCVLSLCPQRAMSRLEELVGTEVEFRYFDAVIPAEYESYSQAATLQVGQVQK